jgi:hypothetical protein
VEEAGTSHLGSMGSGAEADGPEMGMGNGASTGGA